MVQALDTAQLRDFEEVHKACEAAESSAQLSEVIAEAIQQFGFRWFALVDDGDLYKHRSGCMMLTNYPSSWVDEAGRALVRGRAVKAHGAPLTPRQIDCLRLIAAGKTEWEMGKILGLSPSTIHEYVEAARRRYGVKTRSQLVLAAARDGYVSLNYLT